MLKGGDAPPRSVNLPPVDLDHHNTRLAAGLADNFAPWRNGKARAVCLSSTLVQTTLSRSQDEAPGLDCPRSQKHMPMRFAGQFGKCRRHRDAFAVPQRKYLPSRQRVGPGITRAQQEALGEPPRTGPGPWARGPGPSWSKHCHEIRVTGPPTPTHTIPGRAKKRGPYQLAHR